MDEKAFRERAREVALTHLARMLAGLIAAPYSAVRFDLVAVIKLEPQLVDLVRALATFIEHTAIESVPPEQFELARGLEDETHNLVIASMRKRLEKLWPAASPAKPGAH